MRRYIDTGIAHVTRAANFIAGVGDNAKLEEASLINRLGFTISRFAGQEPKLWFEFMVASLLSSTSERDLRMLNPYLSESNARHVFDLTVDVILHTIRLGQIRRCIASARGLIALLERTTHEVIRSNPAILQALELKADEVANNLATKRYFVKPKKVLVPQNTSPGGGASAGGEQLIGEYDPRFLVFEFIHSIRLLFSYM